MTAREIVWNLLTEVNERDALSHVALAEAMAANRPEGPERALVTQLFHGTLERQMTIDTVLARQTGRPVTKIKTKIRNLLRMSVYQMLFLQRIPVAAACNEAVALAKKHGLAGLAGFVNGTLRGLDRAITAGGGQREFLLSIADTMPEMERLSFLYSVPEWIVRLWREDFPKADLETMLAASFAERGVTIRWNKSRGSLEDLISELAREGAAPMPDVLPNCLRLTGGGNPAELAAYREGRFSIQDGSAVLAGNLLPLRAGMRVLDLCAAPGGKTAHAADELTALDADRQTTDCGGEREGFLIEARDNKEDKLPLIRETVERLHLQNVQVRAADAAAFDPEREAWADIVIADVPCSGLGVIGRKPDVKDKTQPEDIQALSEIQRAIVQNAVRYVKPGGYLSYSTCTVDKAENASVAAYIASLGMTPVDIAGGLPKVMRESCERQEGFDGIGVQIFPEPGTWDGFYIAQFRKEEPGV